MSGAEPTTVTHSENLRKAFPAVIGALVCVHASMAATRVTASLLLLHTGFPEWTVGALLSLFAVAPIGLALWAGRLADRHGIELIGGDLTAGPLWSRSIRWHWRWPHWPPGVPSPWPLSVSSVKPA